MVEVNKILEKIKYENYIGNRELSINDVVPINKIRNVKNALSWCGDKNSELLDNVNTN